MTPEVVSVILDGNEGDCPHDSRFEHEFYFGCVPKTFNSNTGRAKGFHQTETPNAYPKRGKASTRWLWDGGCDAHFQAIHEWRAANAEQP